MDGIGLQAVLFIWFSLLSPAIAAIGLFLFRFSRIRRKGYYWFGSILIGYLCIGLLGFAFRFIPPAAHNDELIQGIVFVAVMLVIFVAPILVSLYVSKKCS